MQQPEDKIVVLLRRKDSRSIRLAHDAYGDALYGVVFRIVKNTTLAEQVMCEGFKALYNDIDSYQETERLFIWMVNIFRKLAFNKIKSIKNDDQKIQDHFPDVFISGSFNWDNTGLTKHIEPNAYAQDANVLEDVYYRGVNSSELSDRLGISLENAKKKIRAAFQQLRNLR